MLCPVCKNVELVMSERQGIEIDYCPGCRGVWLDRGELDKIIERSVQAGSDQLGGASNGSHNPIPGAWLQGGHDRHRDSYRGEHHESGRQDHRRSFWKDIFD